MTDDVETVLEAARVERATLVGHSTGGAIAQLLAVRMPDRVAGLVLSSTWCQPGNYFRRCFEFRRSLLEIGATDLFHKAGVFFRYSPRYAETHDAAFDSVGEIDVDITIARINAILGADLSLVTGRITVPTMVLASRDDSLVPAYMSDDVARRIPGARHLELDEGGHFLPETRSDDYNALLDDFFGSLGLPGVRSPEPVPAQARV
jgi:aminoacrylate hydrolase